MIISDDIGSFPLPENIEKEKIQRIISGLIEPGLDLASSLGFDLIENKGVSNENLLYNAVSGAMKFKLNSGIMCPNYPQFRDMIKAYGICERFAEEGKPWVVRDEFARIIEFEMVDKFAREQNIKPDLRVCVTGPLELYLKNFGNNVEPDMLKNIAVSVSKFMKNIKLSKWNVNVKVFSIDEPTLGLNPNIVVAEDDLIKAWNVCVDSVKGTDVQIHLHSSKDIEKVYHSKIQVIGIESAEEPKNLEMIDRSDFEKYDKFLRLGIARTNIFGLAAEYLEKTGEDVWKTGNFKGMVDKMENSKIIGKRLHKGYELFGSRIAYAGPDCGLGGWKTQESGFLLLKNTADAVNEFNKKLR